MKCEKHCGVARISALVSYWNKLFDNLDHWFSDSDIGKDTNSLTGYNI